MTRLPMRQAYLERLVPKAEGRIICSYLGSSARMISKVRPRGPNFILNDFMGLNISIALGMALSTEGKVVSLDGDGSLLMNMGTIATIGREKPKNLVVVVWDNEEWGQTGHQASHTAMGTDLEKVAKGCGVSKGATVTTLEDLDQVFQQALREDGPWFIVAKIQEEEYMSLAPNEPEMTLYRFRPGRSRLQSTPQDRCSWVFLSSD